MKSAASDDETPPLIKRSSDRATERPDGDRQARVEDEDTAQQRLPAPFRHHKHEGLGSRNANLDLDAPSHRPAKSRFTPAVGLIIPHQKESGRMSSSQHVPGLRHRRQDQKPLGLLEV